MIAGIFIRVGALGLRQPRDCKRIGRKLLAPFFFGFYNSRNSHYVFALACVSELHDLHHFRQFSSRRLDMHRRALVKI